MKVPCIQLKLCILKVVMISWKCAAIMWKWRGQHWMIMWKWDGDYVNANTGFSMIDVKYIYWKVYYELNIKIAAVHFIYSKIYAV